MPHRADPGATVVWARSPVRSWHDQAVLRIALVVVGILLMAPAADAQVFRPRSKTGVVHAAKKITPPGAIVATTIPSNASANPMAPTKSPVKTATPAVVNANKTAAKKTGGTKKRVVKKTGGDDDEEVVVVDDDDDE